MQHRVRLTPVLVVAILALVGLAPALTADAQDATPTAAGRPTEGWDLHIDAKAHFPGDPAAIAHHHCKAVAGGLSECLLFASDDPDAPLVDVQLPEMTAEEAAEVAASLEETYGKVYLLWDPTASDLPTGQPFVHDVHAAVEAMGTPTP